LPFAIPVQADSIRAWTRAITNTVAGVLPDDQPWRLHIFPHYHAPAAPSRMGARAWHSRTRHGGPSGSQAPPGRHADDQAGRHRCELIARAVQDELRQRRRHLLRRLEDAEGPFTPSHSLVQVLLTAPADGFLSVAPAPLPFAQRHLLSAFPKGEVPIAVDKQAPSRAFAKLVEAEARLGCRIQPGEQCVDLGAAPGSWTYTAIQRGARVTAVDRAPLREDLARHANVRSVRGDAFTYRPEHPVDWLLCDVIAPAEQSAELLLSWLREHKCRKFVVTLKTRAGQDEAVLERVGRELPAWCEEAFLLRLSANKKEICAFGVRGVASRA
jgi:23S rRNA (cytidine2498-2'-O)-methyltransferase